MKLINRINATVLPLSMLFLGAATISGNASAEMQWSDFSLSYLSGSQYEVGDDSRQFLTVEHASGHNWGDTFYFYDRSKSKNGTLESYAEFSPRLSLSYFTGSDLSTGIINDVFIASTWEQGAFFDNYLLGLGVSLNIPGFNYLKANIYQANNSASDNDQMLTMTFAYPFKLGNADFLYDGFLDWSTSSDTQASEMNFTTQLKYNVGGALGSKSPVYLGVEYAFWNNKYGISGVDERSVSLLFKWHY
ncbi:outer membrane protein OmpK [Thalassotalea piscium]|uniref:Nucleoside-specific outer membrane channel protein Tsx n=1 Tax=Thalassotalea piscium TaxID=1230533 RepID=A0A7X0TUL2_9GAMM|nr:outer membrane protein OmpK [Thalassotalea piscium]MBB6544333.1 nucleoside-specific outer membrane channel protein Tsx [Thalassotalea piscium]